MDKKDVPCVCVCMYACIYIYMEYCESEKSPSRGLDSLQPHEL